jgi:hypothetical protein
MIYNTFLESVYKQLELDFRDIPKWAKALGDIWDKIYKSKYYPIKNMKKGKQRDAAFLKFWKNIILELKKAGFNYYQILDMGVPEYALNLHH